MNAWDRLLVALVNSGYAWASDFQVSWASGDGAAPDTMIDVGQVLDPDTSQPGWLSERVTIAAYALNETEAAIGSYGPYTATDITAHLSIPAPDAPQFDIDTTGLKIVIPFWQVDITP